MDKVFLFLAIHTQKMTNIKITIIGLGYVGLPLALEFSKKFSVVGFDINQNRINDLKNGIDFTLEANEEELKSLNKPQNDSNQGVFFSSSIEDLKDSNFYIVTVPTPIDRHNKPDLRPLYKASETVAKVLKKGDIVVYESTVFPGATEEECVPILEKNAGLVFNTDFFAGYSPERINPGDKEHTVAKILKITSGSTPEAAEKVDQLYKSIITAGTHKASSIRVAEAAKVIENSQRDINIAFINELAKIFNLMGIPTNDVLEAAATKWNFLPFKPGLVGGHCIGVDPYYLAQKAQELGYHPEIILAGRRLNDSMAYYVAAEAVKLLIKNDLKVNNAKLLILGFTFKENCPDIRNTKIIDVYRELLSYGINVTVYDPWANEAEAEKEYGIKITKSIEGKFDEILVAVNHKEFSKINPADFLVENGCIYDLKGVYPKNIVTASL
jgi:UDP-N-acetyl-D-glucosamine/UDP-N-acetyl-D-galactosamine dehydrogenase